MPDIDWSPIGNGMPGVPLDHQPAEAVAAGARIHRQFINHSLTLNDKELQSLLSGRDAGIATLNTSGGKLMPSLLPDTRLKFSTQIADALLDKSLSAQLSREAPTTQDLLQQQDKKFRQIFKQAPPHGAMRAPPPTLLERVPPVGFSVTVYF